MSDKTVPSKALLALTTAAMALPGMTDWAQAAAPVDHGANVRGTYYAEDAMDAENSSSGESSDRYDIKVIQAQYSVPLGANADLVLNAAADFMSGASPWYIQPAVGSTKPEVVMSGATIEDDRYDGTAKGTYYFDSARLAGTVGFSTENDYRSVSSALEGQLDVNNKLTTLAMGLNLSSDTLEPTEGGESLRPVEEEKDSMGVYVGLTQVIDRSSLVQFNLTWTKLDGYLSDPYKWAAVVGDVDVLGDDEYFADTRPDSRSQTAALMRYRRFFPGVAGSMHLDYRYYTDDWGIDSHMVETSWYQNLADGMQLIPTFRYYVQTEADFYSVYYIDEREDGYYSSDYRLSPYGAISLGLKLDMDFSKAWNLNASVERYMSSADYSYEDIQVENPALINFWSASVGFGVKF
jgi:hypothetical protein